MKLKENLIWKLEFIDKLRTQDSLFYTGDVVLEDGRVSLDENAHKKNLDRSAAFNEYDMCYIYLQASARTIEGLLDDADLKRFGKATNAATSPEGQGRGAAGKTTGNLCYMFCSIRYNATIKICKILEMNKFQTPD